MPNCINCPFRAGCRPSAARLLECAVELGYDDTSAGMADRVLKELTPLQIERIAMAALITMDPATDCRAIVKAELIAALDAADWDTRPALQ